MTVTLLFAALAVWLAIPFVPAVHEWLRKRDAAPLPLARANAEDRRIAPVEAHSHPDRLDVEHADAARAGSDLWVTTAIASHAAAGARVVARRGAVLGGSAEAGGAVGLEPGARFERVHAPAVQTLRDDGARRTPHPTATATLPDRAETSGGRTLVRGDVSLAPDTFHDGDLVVRGRLTLGAGACVRGSVKARRGIALGDAARVTGNAVSGGDLDLAPDATVGGAAIADGALRLGRRAVVGRAGAATTATGARVEVATGVCVFGTLWAREHGEVLVSDAPAVSQG